MIKKDRAEELYENGVKQSLLQVPYCCGATLLAGISTVTRKEIPDPLTRWRATGGYEIVKVTPATQEAVLNSHGSGFTIAIVGSNQKREVKNLHELGFHCVAKGIRNPSHRNESPGLDVFIRINSKEEFKNVSLAELIVNEKGQITDEINLVKETFKIGPKKKSVKKKIIGAIRDASGRFAPKLLREEA